MAEREYAKLAPIRLLLWIIFYDEIVLPDILPYLNCSWSELPQCIILNLLLKSYKC